MGRARFAAAAHAPAVHLLKKSALALTAVAAVATLYRVAAADVEVSPGGKYLHGKPPAAKKPPAAMKQPTATAGAAKSLYELRALAADGAELDFSALAGKAVLMVNVASS